MTAAKFRVVPIGHVASWVHELHTSRPSMALGMLLAGDRFSCITEAVVAEMDGKIIGIATIASEGEQMSGKPTIVAIYVLHEYRSGGIGFQLFETAIDHMINVGLIPIRIDVMNSKVKNMVDKLPAEKRGRVNVVDMSMGGILDFMLDA